MRASPSPYRPSRVSYARESLCCRWVDPSELTTGHGSRSWPACSELSAPSRSWHTARDGFAELASWASLVTGSLGKIGQDIAMMAQNEIAEVTIEGGGKSSAMHHKSNPVDAEILVALARYNAGMSGSSTRH